MGLWTTVATDPQFKFLSHECKKGSSLKYAVLLRRELDLSLEAQLSSG